MERIPALCFNPTSQVNTLLLYHETVGRPLLNKGSNAYVSSLLHKIRKTSSNTRWPAKKVLTRRALKLLAATGKHACNVV